MEVRIFVLRCLLADHTGRSFQSIVQPFEIEQSIKIADNSTKTALDHRFHQPLTIPEPLATVEKHLPGIRFEFSCHC